MSEFPVANPKSDPDFSVFITKLHIFFNITYPVRSFGVPTTMSSRNPEVRVPQFEDHFGVSSKNSPYRCSEAPSALYCEGPSSKPIRDNTKNSSCVYFNNVFVYNNLFNYVVVLQFCNSCLLQVPVTLKCNNDFITKNTPDEERILCVSPY
jgi:hypothetical protein